MMEREGPAYTCSTPACGIQIAQSNVPIDVRLNLYEFRDAYNIITDENLVNFGNVMEWGYAVSCINCLEILGWRDEEEDGLFHFRYDRVVPPPPANPLPPPANPLPPPANPLPQLEAPPPHPANLQDNQTLSNRNVAAPIDKLPRHLLPAILSFLPTRFAVRTSVLSKKWKDLWRLSTSFCFIYSGKDTWAGGVTETVRRLTTKLSTFHLIVDNVPTRQTDVDDWVYHAMHLKADNMSIRFIGGDHDHRFWDDFYVNHSLKEFKLQIENYDMHPKKDWDVKWPILTSLSLCCPYIPQEILDNMLNGCPLLRILAIDRCAEQLVDFDLRKTPTITRFDLRCDYIESKPEIMKIDAPKIRYLKLYFDSPCLLVDVQSLEEAILNGYLHSWATEDSLTDMMDKLQSVTKFTFGSELLMMLSLAQVHDVPSPTFKVEDLTLETKILRSVLPGIRRLLQNSPALKKLTIDLVKLITIDPSKANWSSQGLHMDQMWESNDGVYHLAGKDGEPELVLSVIHFLLRNTTSLETLVVRLGGYLDESEFVTLAMMTPSKIGNVTVVLKQSCVRAFTSIFDGTGCSEHGNNTSMMF